MNFVKLKSVCNKFDYGYTASATDKETGHKFLRITDIQNGFVDWEKVPFCECNEDAVKKYHLEPGDIVFARTGSVGNTSIIENAPSEAVFASYLIRIRPDIEKVVPKFLAYYFRTPHYWTQIEKTAVGAINKGINATTLRKLSVPISPLPQQKRIATILDKADRLRRLRRYALEVGESYLQSVFLEMFGDPVTNPMGWEFKKLDSIADIASGVTKGQDFKGKKTIELPYLRVANVQDGFLDLSEIKTIETLPKKAEKLYLRSGDIVMTEGGDYDKLGRGAIWRGQIPNCIHQNHIFRVRLDKNLILPEYFSNYLLTRFTKNYFLNASKQTTNLATINMTQMKRLPVLLPSFSKQNDFFQVVCRYERLRAQQREALRQAESLFRSLLHEAFGEGL